VWLGGGEENVGLREAYAVSCTLKVFFDAQGLVHYEFIPEVCTANKEIYVEVLCRLRNAVRRKWARNSWLLHDSAPAHRSLVVKKYLAKHDVTALEHPPYSTDLRAQEVTSKATRTLTEVSKNGFEASKSFTIVAKVCHCPMEEL
jgi:hypothetical protein